MSDLDRSVGARIDAHRPATAPPFAAMVARQRRRRVGQTGSVAAAVLAVVVGAAAVSAHRAGPPDSLVQRGVTPTPSFAEPSHPPIAAGKQRPSAADRAAYQLWRRHGAQNYAMKVALLCYCSVDRQPTLITVRNGKVYPPVAPSDRALGAHPSIDGLFGMIFSGKADRFTVTYDPTYGFPAEVTFDYILNAIDDENTFTITDYRPT